MIPRVRKRQSGQILPIAAAAFVLMSALAGLAIDASRDYLTKRNEQNAADFAVLAAAKQMSLSGNISSPIASGSYALYAAHDYATQNGFDTIFNGTCDTPGPGSFTTTWFDTGVACNATTGFTNKVTVNSPPVALPGSPAPLACTGSGKFSCVQVVITTRISELFTSILGIGFAYVTAGASAIATLPGGAYDAPYPNAVTIYQPTSVQGGCDPANRQCYDETKKVQRKLLSCDPGAANNCPTFWAGPSTQPKFYGFDGTTTGAGLDLTALQSNGDMVMEDQTTICDPFNGLTCAANTVVGPSGFAVPPNTKLYCSAYGAGGAGQACVPALTPAGQPALNKLDSKQGAFSPTPWYPTVDTSGLPFCGSLVLNGQPVSGACSDPAEPYVIGPGIYQFIVINHGYYEFEAGLFDITGLAPVNTAPNLGGYTANGIDHSRETASDFDLCAPLLPAKELSCPTLRAGVWIGHGGGNFAAYQGPVPGSCTNGLAGSGGGGGDPTVISGSGVVFRMEPSSGSFVSTHEVQAISLAGAGVGSLASVSGSPLLFDLENNGWIHLDSQPGNTGSGGNGVPPNTTSGIIYQTPLAKAGGVEYDPSMAGFTVNNVELPAISGQVLAYTLTTFGQSGGTLDFTHGYGGGSVPGIGTSGRNETQIISGVNLAAGAPGYSVLTVGYTDEYAMDAYDIYLKVNNGLPVFFSQGIWNPPPGAGSPTPPPGNNPSDTQPNFPTGSEGTYASETGSFTGTSGASADYLYNIPASGGATIEVSGQWTWGHENTIGNPPATSPISTGTNLDTITYTFPNPAGAYLSVSVFVLDGDRCGDYAYANYTFRSTGGPGPGQQSIGSVLLVQ